VYRNSPQTGITGTPPDSIDNRVFHRVVDAVDSVGVVQNFAGAAGNTASTTLRPWPAT
jgi:hypothetical protein